MDDSYYQAFRSRSSSEVVTIPTRHDSKSGQRVVRWKDIKQHFENAKTILNGKYSVLFLTDDDLEEIAHHPGVTLEVIVDDNARGYQSPTDIHEFTPTGPSDIQPLDNHLVSLHSSISLHDTHTRQSLAVLPQYTPTSRTTDQHDHDNPPSSLCEVKGSMDQQGQFGQLKQQTQQMQRQIEEILQNTASMQTSEHQSRQQFQQQIDNMAKRLEQLQEWVNQADRGNPLTLDQMRGDFSWRQLEILNRHILIHDRIQALLRDFTKEPSAPRFFFILSQGISHDCTEDASSSRLFRLHFLCECGSHTMSKDSKEPHEVHMTNHPGYDLKRPKEFFDKYGSHVLTMMHMVKYGIMGAGFVVPPLLQSKHTGMIGQSQEQDCLTKENMGRLIDDTITDIEKMSRATDRDTNTQRWSLIRTELSDVKSYLNVNDDGHFPGGVHQLTSLEQHCWWVCKEHQYEWTLEQLKDVVNTTGGTHVESPGNINIKVNPDNVTKQLYDMATKICTIQYVKDKRSLIMDCGRLSLTTDGSQDVQDVVMTIKRLSDLTTDDTEFIRHCNLIKLSIKFTPLKGDEDKLVNILQQSHTLQELRVGTLGERSLEIINLIISAREVLQDGRWMALRKFELMEEELNPFNFDRKVDKQDHMSVTLTFSEGSSKIDMDTRLVLPDSDVFAEGTWICNFIRQYGWSISHLNTASMLNDHLATVLENSTQIQGSKLTHLTLSQHSLTNIGMDSMNRVIKRSRDLAFFGAWLVGLHKESQPEKVAPFLERYGARLNKLTLRGNAVERWLPTILKSFPPRSGLPTLDYLDIRCHTKHAFPRKCIAWLVSIISVPLQPPEPSTIGDTSTGTPQSSGKPCAPQNQLKKFRLCNITLVPEDWEALIKAVDLSVMLELLFGETNFSQVQLDLLLDRIAGAGKQSTSLKCLDIRKTDLVINANKDALRNRIQKVAPRLKVQGL
ncbi:hypothetical protein BGX31_010698 [Mortierella sp. GBA43]|nr:hypothetical protein BGX31_010698 [Mortierella sp. GBA43]